VQAIIERGQPIGGASSSGCLSRSDGNRHVLRNGLPGFALFAIVSMRAASSNDASGSRGWASITDAVLVCIDLTTAQRQAVTIAVRAVGSKGAKAWPGRAAAPLMSLPMATPRRHFSTAYR